MHALCPMSMCKEKVFASSSVIKFGFYFEIFKKERKVTKHRCWFLVLIKMLISLRPKAAYQVQFNEENTHTRTHVHTHTHTIGLVAWIDYKETISKVSSTTSCVEKLEKLS